MRPNPLSKRLFIPFALKSFSNNNICSWRYSIVTNIIPQAASAIIHAAPATVKRIGKLKTKNKILLRYAQYFTRLRYYYYPVTYWAQTPHRLMYGCAWVIAYTAAGVGNARRIYLTRPTARELLYFRRRMINDNNTTILHYYV